MSLTPLLPFQKHYESITVTDKTRLKCVTTGAFFTGKEERKLRNGSKILAVFLKKINALPALFSVSPDNQPTEKKIGDSTKKFRFHRDFEGLKTP